MIYNEDTVFYHGTTNKYSIGDYITPASKSNAQTIKTLYRRKTAKVYVTNNVDAAKFYANRSAEQSGEQPIIYIVRPDKQTLVKVSKTDFATANAQILDIYNED